MDETLDVEPEELQPPESVRTPGRTWTEMPRDLPESGEGSIDVQAPDEVVVEEADEVFRLIEIERNSFHAFHASNLEPEDAVRLRIEESPEEPVRIETRLQEGFYPHHVVVEVEDGVEVEVIEENLGTGFLDSSMTEAVLGDSAELEYTRLNSLGECAGYSVSRVHTGENSTVDWTTVSTGSELYRNKVRTELRGRHSQLCYRLGFLSSSEQHMDHTAEVVHASDSTSCDIDARGVAMDSSRAVYKGVQQVDEEAENTESFQNEKTVVMGEDAEADTTPQLRIDNSDVEATHAATTGHIDKQDLFYMRSRGIRGERARREIISGMFEDLLDAEAMSLVKRKIEDSLTSS
ncbi:MAG: SufD family Fe-S cluster assembly protein [Candidatus Nanohaloarchaea archaeon]